MELLIMHFSQSLVTSSLLGPNILFITLFSTPSIYVLPLARGTKLYTHTKQQVNS
jgi:hypothetical protein